MQCSPVQDIPEEGYLQHMKVVHGNAPQSITPQVTTPGKPPVDPEFSKTWALIEEAEKQKKLEQAQKPQEQAVLPNSPVPVVEKPIELTYVYAGTHNGHRVETLELDVDGKHFAIAFDPIEKKQVESREVADLNGKGQVKFVEPNQLLGEKQIPLASLICEICGKNFDSKRALGMHKVRVHK